MDVFSRLTTFPASCSDACDLGISWWTCCLLGDAVDEGGLVSCGQAVVGTVEWERSLADRSNAAVREGSEIDELCEL